MPVVLAVPLRIWVSNTTFSVVVNLTDGQAHDLTLYAVDWSNIGRSEQIQINSAATGAVLDTETLSHFYSGAYLQWEISGSVVITVKTLAGADSVLSGLFFDSPSTSNAVTASQFTRNVTVPGSLKTNAIDALDNSTTPFADPADSTVALNATSMSSTSLALLNGTEDSWITPLIDLGDGSSQAVSIPWFVRGPRTMELKPPGFRRAMI